VLAVTIAWAEYVMESLGRLQARPSLGTLFPALLPMFVQARRYAPPTLAGLSPPVGAGTRPWLENAGDTTTWLRLVQPPQYRRGSSFYTGRERPGVGRRAVLG